MLKIRERHIHDIPVLEVIDEKYLNEPRPLIIFYHGWQTNKELLLTQGRRLADKGFRVILPDGMHHGQRKVAEKSSVPSVTFFSTIQYNLIEFDVIIRYFKERQLILKDRIGVGGYSMGGMTVAGLLTQHPEIKVGASIMGTPSPVEYAASIRSVAAKRGYHVPSSLEAIHSWLPQFDLSELPEKVAGRHLLVWHGTEDEKIPYDPVEKAYQKMMAMESGKSIQFLKGENEGHLVTIDLMETIADYFEEHMYK